MATESPKERSDEATLTSAPELTNKIDSESQNVDLNRPHVNGDRDAPASATDEFENKHISDIVDDLVNSTEVSISGGSDNEAARSDASKNKDPKSRASSAVKKPAAFKAINVNKTFLTAKASAPGAQPKASEKSPAASSATPPPTSTATTSRPRLVAKIGSGLITKGAGASGPKPAPDPSAVWNKNRPAPPPEPKKYTDEELKKYGIHMATRLQTDDGKGQPTWADIDDDDDDWDPDTITWKDGTKVAIAPPEERSTPTPEPTASKEAAAADKTKTSAPSVTPVKPGLLGSGKGLVLKGVPEKPTLVAKPPAPPTPAKSPWAPLPKIEKVSPIAPDLPAQAGPKFPPRDVSAHPSHHTPQPPKEIAADDFSRAPWRDGPPGGNRELFNSHSGRYEPVHDRRGPMRAEPSYGRQPALMQRPPHHEQQGPVDHPAAFPGRGSEQHGPYGRRRGSSNASGGSGSWQRLKSLERPLPPPELVNARRPSMAGASDGPASPRLSQSGLQSGPRHGQAWQPRASPGTVHATPFHQGVAPDNRGMPPSLHPSPSTMAAVPVTEDDYELQKRLMRERRELAMRRRQEEEAREEAARKERIRLKLEALGPPPETSKAKRASAKEQAPTPTQIQSRETAPSEKAAPAESKAAEKAAPAETAADATKDPTPHTSGSAAPSLPQADRAEQQGQAHGAGHDHPWAAPSRQTDRPPAVWGPQPSAKNVWAAPHNNRTLGNGTFAADIGTSQLPAGPGPIAPPNSARAASTHANMTPAAARQPPIGPPRQPQAPRNAGERDMKDNPWAAAVRRDDEKLSEMLKAQYEDRERRLQTEGRSINDIQPIIKDTWRPTKLDENGARITTATKQTLHIGQDSPWTAPVDSKPVPQAAQAASTGAAPARDMGTAFGTKAAAQGRGSRFFPSRDARQDSRDIRLEASAEALRHDSPSPPPPDMAGHPAFDGDATHPHVSLPRPHPVVRLPPSAATEPAASAPESGKTPAGQPKGQAPSFAWAAQTAYKEPETAPRGPAHKPENVWQAKIDNLLGGRKVPPARPSADNRVSHPQHPEPAAPGPSAPSAEMNGSVITKVMAEECFEEQEMGSVPPIRLPKTIPEMAWQPSPSPKPLSKKLFPVVVSADTISFPVDVSGAGTVWRVRLPGTESKSITVPFGRARSNPRRGGPRGGRHGSSAQHRGKGRESSSGYSGEQGASGSAHHGRNHRGGYRGRDNWSRNTTAQIQT